MKLLPSIISSDVEYFSDTNMIDRSPFQLHNISSLKKDIDATKQTLDV